jgi:hypothetical protein
MHNRFFKTVRHRIEKLLLVFTFHQSASQPEGLIRERDDRAGIVVQLRICD